VDLTRFVLERAESVFLGLAELFTAGFAGAFSEDLTAPRTLTLFVSGTVVFFFCGFLAGLFELLMIINPFSGNNWLPATNIIVAERKP